MRTAPALAVLLFALSAARADNPVVLLWPNGAPGETGADMERATPAKGDNITRLTDVSRPSITLYKAPADKNTGAAVLICPGGGYNILAWNLEGTEIAEWFNSIGVSAAVLKYRVPSGKVSPRHTRPLQDAQRAMGIIRSRAGEWGIDANRVGVLGFSAGGHLAAALSNNYDKRTYEAADDADKLSSKPDFTVLIYPAYLTVAKEGDKVSPELPVTSKTPQTFIAMTQDDGVRVEGALFYYLALRTAKVPAEMHLYPVGGHGYGLRPSANLVSTWPARVGDWMKSRKLLEPAK